MGDTSYIRTFECQHCKRTVSLYTVSRTRFCSQRCWRASHAGEHREYHAKYRAEHKDQIRKKNRGITDLKKSMGWCQTCEKGVLAVPGKTMCQKHLDERKKRSNSWRKEWGGKNLCLGCGRVRMEGLLYCYKCSSRASVRQREVGSERKNRIIGLLGGECNDCGYTSDIPTVFDVHHLNPRTKEWSFKAIKTWSWEKIEAELSKGVVLLCANCHRIRHYRDPGNKANWKDV